ncbi:MAG TPA: ribulose-phosphate 3-epimerase, partial [Sphingomicrobium sp.]
QLKKIEAIAKRVIKEGLDVQIEVDGGIDPTTARQAVDAGANVLVAGTAAFRGGADSYAANVRALRGEA